jgi:hypothetical protein
MHSAAHLGSSVHRRLVVLAPAGQQSPPLRGVGVASGADHPLLASLQRLRGRVCVQEGVVLPSELTPDGRHVQAADSTSFHIVCADRAGTVHGCVRYQLHSPDVKFRDLAVAHSPLGKSERWRPALRNAVTRELAIARRQRLAYVEVGAWVVSEQLRCSSEAVRMVMAVYALGRAMGGALGIATATTCHNSAPMLHRMGGEPLDLPTYYDPRYRATMRVLKFDSSRPNEKYLDAIDAFQSVPMRPPFGQPVETAMAASA